MCKKKVIKVPCEVYSRIVGYLRPIQNWNTGKQQEFSEREEFVVTEARLKEKEAQRRELEFVVDL